MRRARTHTEMSLLFIKAQTLLALSLSLSPSLPPLLHRQDPGQQAVELAAAPVHHLDTPHMRRCALARRQYQRVDRQSDSRDIGARPVLDASVADRQAPVTTVGEG